MSFTGALLLLWTVGGCDDGGLPIDRRDGAAIDAAGEPDAAMPDATPDGAAPDAAAPVDASVAPDAGAPDAGGEAWAWSMTWPGLVFEGTTETPSARVDLPIPGGATVRQLEVLYSVEIGTVEAGKRHQLDFTCADARHPYRGGLFGFLFITGELGRFIFRNGRPGEGAAGPTRLPFRGPTSTRLDVHLRWDAVAGSATVTVTDEAGGSAGITSTEKVEPTPVASAITLYLGYSIPTDQEALNIGWRYSDLTVRAAP